MAPLSIQYFRNSSHSLDHITNMICRMTTWLWLDNSYTALSSPVEGDISCPKQCSKQYPIGIYYTGRALIKICFHGQKRSSVRSNFIWQRSNFNKSLGSIYPNLSLSNYITYKSEKDRTFNLAFQFWGREEICWFRTNKNLLGWTYFDLTK